MAPGIPDSPEAQREGQAGVEWNQEVPSARSNLDAT